MKGKEMSSYYDIPERSIAPPEPFCVLADCQHEVYEGERLFDWEGHWICGDCLKDKVAALSIEELADAFGCSSYTVTEPHIRRLRYV